MPARFRRGLRGTEGAAEDGPFVSFTDLFIGILFLFLILVAALMLMHQDAVQKVRQEMQAYQGVTQQAQQMQAKLDAAARLDAQHPPFRLAIVYNVYQHEESVSNRLAALAGVQQQWTFVRTVRIFRDPTGLCIDNLLLENPHMSSSWQPPLNEQDIPTADQQTTVRGVGQCTLTAAGEKWSSDTESGDIQRVAADLYTGKEVLHTGSGDTILDVQYRILGLYDDFFNMPTTSAP